MSHDPSDMFGPAIRSAIGVRPLAHAAHLAPAYYNRGEPLPMYAKSRGTKPFTCLALLLVAVGAWTYSTRHQVTPSPPMEDPAPRAEPHQDSSMEAASNTAYPGTAPSRTDRVAALPALSSSGAAAHPAGTKRVWLLSFTLLTERAALPETAYVRAAGKRCRATWDPEAMHFLADVGGSRRALEATDLLVVVGEGETATLLPIQVSGPDAFNGIGTTPLRGADWDMRLLRINAGAVQIQEPPRLGALILESPAELHRSFDVRWEGGSRAVSQSVDFEQGQSRAELVTFLPTTHWTVEATESRWGQPVPEWSATAAAGEDILVPPDPATGVAIFVAPRLLPKVGMVSLLALPAPERRTISADELYASSQANSLPTLSFGGSRWAGTGTDYSPLTPMPVAPGSYMVEAWLPADENGVMELLRAAPAVIDVGLVRVELD